MNVQTDSATADAGAQPVIGADSFVTLHYRISLTQAAAADAAQTGEADFLNTFADKPATLQMGLGQLAPALEQRLIGLAQGEHHVFDVPAGEAYGQRSAELVQRVSRELLKRESELLTTFEPGDVVEFNAPATANRPAGRFAGVVKEIDAQGALFDFNHPLAGQPIRFEVKIIGVL